MKVLPKVIYFSRKYENLIDGKVVELAKGNTEVVAAKISQSIACEQLELQAVTSYPKSYNKMVEIAENEKRDQLRPLFYGLEKALKREILFLGFSNWCGGLPKIVVHFLENYNIKGKTIFPFCTLEGSAFGNSLFELKALCPHAKIMTDRACCTWLSCL
ncbi:flavodoxin [Tetragenococcus halophilus]|uniref:flavodoxin n=1 Tax=Tetragenococcus halophilus TaxID=51669 RepID=UPI001E5A4422|nr:flavodoxin [Tetragenococcus halophilus]